MIRKLSLFLTFIFAFSCSIFEQSKSVDTGRKISSLPMDDVLIAEDEESIRVKGTVRVYGKRDGYNSFSFPLHNLDSPFYDDIPYTIIVTNVDVTCSHSNNISREGLSNVFKVKKYSYGDYFRCSYNGDGEGFFNFVYILPKLKTFAVSEAEYMKGFSPDIVSNMELTLAKIYEKLAPKDGKKPERLYFRERELLLKYVPDVMNITFDPKKFEVQFKTTIGPQDLFKIHKINGVLTHSKWGTFSYEGYADDDYLKYGGAGAKYLRNYGIKPFGLYCRHTNQDFDFEYINEIMFSDKGKVECSINSRKSKFLRFRVPKGEVSAEIQIMRTSKAIKHLPNYYLNKAQNSISKKINEMNENNSKLFRGTIKKAIKRHEEEIVDMLSVDKKFPFNINVKARIVKRTILNKPMFRYENKNGREAKYLSYRVFVKNIYEDIHGGEFHSSDIFLGELKTNLIINEGKTLSSYSLLTDMNDYDFQNKVKNYIKTYSTGKDIVVYSSYKKLINKYSNNQKNSPKKSDEVLVELSRFSLNICGKILAYDHPDGSKKEHVMLNVVKARYDLYEGKNSGAFRSMFTDHFYYEQFQLEKPIEISTPIPFTGDNLTKDQCYHITPSEFADGTYENSVVLKNI